MQNYHYFYSTIAQGYAGYLKTTLAYVKYFFILYDTLLTILLIYRNKSSTQCPASAISVVKSWFLNNVKLLIIIQLKSTALYKRMVQLRQEVKSQNAVISHQEAVFLPILCKMVFIVQNNKQNKISYSICKSVYDPLHSREKVGNY